MRWADLPAMASASLRYGVALASSAVALLAALVIYPNTGDPGFAALLFLGSVGVSGWFGGFGPALLAAACGALALDYFFESPPYTFQVTNPRTLTALLSFLLMSILLGSLNARLRISNHRLRSERDRAEAAVGARDELIATVSHDLRTPLTAIKTSVYSLRDPDLNLSIQTRERLLSNIEAESDRLVHFVTNALALQRLESRPSPQWETIAPGELVSAVLDRCLPALGPRSLTFSVPDDLPEMRLDASLFAQALTVLLENVAVHTPPGSPLMIEGRMPADELRLSVSDAGPGIPASERERIFIKYERLDHASSGAGLGLAIARAAVEAQGGCLTLGDSPLGGACFTIRIPNAIQRRLD